MRVAINGFGRIGRAFFKVAVGRDDIEVVAINDLGDKERLEYLLAYDSVHGKPEDHVLEAFHHVRFLQEKDPAKLPWGEMNIDVVVESTGFFTDYEKARGHIEAGAKNVAISGPVKSEEGPNNATVLVGVNEERLATCDVTSNASCTTNAASPLVAILDETVGIDKALLNTIHAYTATQALVDGPGRKGFREGRAAAVNVIPSSTGAAIATAKAHTQLQDKFDGISIRVPVPVGSIADITFIAKRETSVEEINEILREAASSPRWEGIFAVTDDPVVSSDIIGVPYASIADLEMTRVIGGNLVKVLAWYDNETGYANTLARHVVGLGSQKHPDPEENHIEHHENH